MFGIKKEHTSSILMIPITLFIVLDFQQHEVGFNLFSISLIALIVLIYWYVLDRALMHPKRLTEEEKEQQQTQLWIALMLIIPALIFFWTAHSIFPSADSIMLGLMGLCISYLFWSIVSTFFKWYL